MERLERFRAYEGKEPYAFISYAHMDSERVYEIISALNNDGFRVWYDQGIEIARRYKAVINEHIEKCAAFVVFATRAGIKREEVIDECAYAIALRKKMVIVYLEDIPNEELDAALRATFAINQRVMWHTLPDWERQYKLRDALAGCRGEKPVVAETAAAENEAAVDSVSVPAKKNTIEEYAPTLLAPGLSKKMCRNIWIGVGLFLLPAVLSCGEVIALTHGNGAVQFLGLFLNKIAMCTIAIDWGNLWLSIVPTSDSARIAVAGYVGSCIAIANGLIISAPVVYAAITRLSSSEKINRLRILSKISVICTVVLWAFPLISILFTYRHDDRFTAIVHTYIGSVYGILRDVSIIFAGRLALDHVKLQKYTSKKVSRFLWISAIVIAAFGVLYGVINCAFYDSSEMMQAVCANLTARTLCFPWLFIILMNIAKDRVSENSLSH